MNDAVLCYIFKDDKVLLQKKSRGKFGGGKWNAPGGKINEGETPEDAAIREVKEETGLDVTELESTGVLEVKSEGDSFSIHVFKTHSFNGTPQHGEEGTLKWFDTNTLPYNDMWEDDRHWLPYLLRDEKFTVHMFFTRDFKKLVEYTIDSERI